MFKIILLAMLLVAPITAKAEITLDANTATVAEMETAIFAAIRNGDVDSVVSFISGMSSGDEDTFSDMLAYAVQTSPAISTDLYRSLSSISSDLASDAYRVIISTLQSLPGQSTVISQVTNMHSNNSQQTNNGQQVGGDEQAALTPEQLQGISPAAGQGNQGGDPQTNNTLPAGGFFNATPNNRNRVPAENPALNSPN